MGRGKKAPAPSETGRRMRPALSPAGREEQCISLAYDLVEKRLREGTATSQETTHFLKLASPKERIEREILEKQRELIIAKTESLQAQKRMEEIYTKALAAMRLYSGNGGTDDDQDVFEPDTDSYI